MTGLLIKTFVKDSENTNDLHVRERYASLAGYTGIILNIMLFAVKLFVGIVSGSVAVIADAFNNISDAGASVVTLIGFRLASKPIDSDHPLGHGRFEYISGFVVDMLIILVGFELLTSSFDKILHPAQVEVSVFTFVMLIAAILVKFWLFLFYAKIAEIISSSAIKASSTDSISDCIATTLVVLSAACAHFGLSENIPADGIVGIIVALFILYTGINAAKETIDLLLGSAPDKEFILQIYDFARKYPEIMGVHDIMVHDYGPGRKFISFHAEVDRASDINYAHEVIDRMELDMHEYFRSIVTVHMDPVVVTDPVVNEMLDFVRDCADEVHPLFSVHDFRMTKNENAVNLIFDLVVPSDCSLTPAEAEEAVRAEITSHLPECVVTITAEHPFV
ncbi:MAG: cation transporter [Anaerofustis stercorihominis]|nr:cation transporter [Anaerofustis stercorihominis]